MVNQKKQWLYQQPNSANDFNFVSDWSHGLCGCLDDFSMCCCVFFCPCLSCCAIDKALGVREISRQTFVSPYHLLRYDGMVNLLLVLF